MAQTNWEKFLKFMHEDCGMHFDEKENFVVCSECGEPIYKEDFDYSTPSCPCCTYNIITDELDCDSEEEEEEEE